MNNLAFKFYSVLKNEDAMPYIGDNVLVAADGLGGSGSTVHAINRVLHSDMRGDILSSAYGDMSQCSSELAQYIEELIAPMVDGKDDSSALWASRIVIARCVYALTEGKFKGADLDDKKVREKLVDFISDGLVSVAKKFDLQKGKYDGQLLLPTTLAFMRYTEAKNTVIAETVWAGDSRCYALTLDGLKLLSVDDEDQSGAITNLFYSGNRKAVLNYLSHEIVKPCVLMVVSDGVFDPFDPHDHLGVEHTLLSAIKECSSTDELSDTLKKFYDDVRGDDSTMAFVPFGFSDYFDMQKKFAERTNEILAIRQKQAQLYSALEVMNQSEDEASHYVLSRVGDRYDYIVPMLIEALEKSVSDIAITPKIMSIVDSVERDYGVSAEKAKKQQLEQSLTDLYNYVKEHPELVISRILTRDEIMFNGNKSLEYAFADMKKYAADYTVAVNDGTAIASEAQLNARSEKLHRRIMERITFYRDRFDRLWDDKTSDYKVRSSINYVLRIWQDIDVSLQYNWGVSNIGALPEKDRELAYEVRDFIDEYRKVKRQIKAKRVGATAANNQFVRAWNTVFSYLENNLTTIPVLLCYEIVHQFGFDTTDESFVVEFGKGKRDRLLRELKEHKAIIVPDIVKALSDNCDKLSLIDSQFNATKLEMFRTYYRLKVNPDNDVKAFEMQLSAIEAAYTSLVKISK